MYLATDYCGIVETPKKKPIKALFCKHLHVIEGEACSKNGMRRISGQAPDVRPIAGRWMSGGRPDVRPL